MGLHRCIWVFLIGGPAQVAAARARKSQRAAVVLARPVATRLIHSAASERIAPWPATDLNGFGAAPIQPAYSYRGTQVSGRQMKALMNSHGDDRPQRHGLSPFNAAVAAQEQEPHGSSLHLLAAAYGTEYMGPLGVGTRRGPDGTVQPAATLQVIFDTGSADLWLLSDLCQAASCTRKPHQRFNHTSSETFALAEGAALASYKTTYGSGRIEGVMGRDDVSIGNFTVKGQTVGLIREESGAIFDLIPLDGVAGLGFVSLTASGTTPLFDSLVQQRVMPAPEFAFYLHPDFTRGGAVLWGGFDRRLYEGPLVWYPVNQEGWWTLDLEAVTFGKLVMRSPHKSSTPGGPSLQLLVDTGTTFITAFGNLYSEIMEQAPPMDCSNVGSLPPLVYTLRDSEGKLQNITIPGTEYMVSVQDHCRPGIIRFGEQLGHDFAGKMILGEVFMRHHFTAFRRRGGRSGLAEVGIARAAGGPGAEAFLMELQDENSAPTEDA